MSDSVKSAPAEIVFENILIPMEAVAQPADELLLQPVTQLDEALKEAGIPITGVSHDGKEFRIDFDETATKEQRLAAEEIAKKGTFVPKRPLSVAELAKALTTEQVNAALSYAAAREVLSDSDLAKRLGVDLYVPVSSPVSLGPDDHVSPAPTVRGLREPD